MLLRINNLEPEDIAKYRDKSQFAIKALHTLIKEPSQIVCKPNIGEKLKCIANHMGLQQEGGNAFYNTFVSLNNNVFFLIRNANHNNTNPELYNKHERLGRPNKRFNVFFRQGNEFSDNPIDFLGSEHHTIPYPVNALDTENDVIAYCEAYIELFHNGSTTFPKLPLTQNNENKQNNTAKTIRLAEADLRRMIRQCIDEALHCLEAKNV